MKNPTNKLNQKNENLCQRKDHHFLMIDSGHDLQILKLFELSNFLILNEGVVASPAWSFAISETSLLINGVLVLSFNSHN